MNAPAAFGSPVLDELVEVIGDVATRRLARTFAGTVLYVPRKLGIHHPIVAAIGAEAAAKLAAYIDGREIQIPRREEIMVRHRRVRALAKSGSLTRAAIAREVGLSERRIYQLLEGEDNEDQLDLFEADRP